MFPANDVTVVVRAIGERTAAACQHLLSHQVPEENIVLVSNAPFSATLADSYRTGIERGLPWTLCIDADVLVGPGVVRKFLEAASTADQEVFEIQGLILDKFFGVRRPAGNHLYRTSLLSRALGLIPHDGEDIRPEHYTLNKMARAGHPWVQTPLAVGLHDFEQFHCDIFRKCYVHARKHDFFMHLLVEYWRRMVLQDDDYLVALWGLASGIADTGDIQVDVRHDYGFYRWVPDEKWSEKPPLEPAQVTPEGVERTLTEWASPGGGLERLAANWTKEIVYCGEPLRPKVQKRRFEGGLLKVLPWVTGRALWKVGRRLERLASH